MRPRVEEQIRMFVQARPAGEPFVPADLATYGTRAGVDQALGRLTREGLVTRVARGIYVRPKQSTIIGAVPVSPLAAAQARARALQLPVVPNGAQVLADYGLSTQTPVVTVLGAGVTGRRTMQLGQHKAVFQPVPRYVLNQAGTPLAAPLAALAFLGRPRAAEAGQLLDQLEPSVFEALLALRPTLPGWLADLLTRTARKEAAR